MGAFQTGFSIGNQLFQQSLDNKWREENRQRDDEERALRLEASRLAIEQSRRTAANQGQADELIQQLANPNAGNYTLTNPKASGAGLRMPTTVAAADQAGPMTVRVPVVGDESGPNVTPDVSMAPVVPVNPTSGGLRMPAGAGAAVAAPAAAPVSLKAAPTRGDAEALLGRIALLKGDLAGFRAAQTNQRTMQEDDLFAQKLGEYKGTADQVAGTVAYLNNNSRRLTMGTPDKNGLVQLAVAKDDGTASFLSLSKQDQAKLYAAGHLLERNPTRALEMMAGVNKELAAAVAADNGLTANLTSNSNDVAGKSATMTHQVNADANDKRRTDGTITHQANVDKRAADAAAAGAAEKRQAKADAKAKANAAVAFYLEENPDATPARLAAVRAGVIEAVATADKNAPAEVKLANAWIKAGVAKNLAEGLRLATETNSKSPESIRADMYLKTLAANMGDATRAKEATEEGMKYLYPAGSATPAKPAKPLANVTPADITSTAKKYGITEDEVKRRLGIK